MPGDIPMMFSALPKDNQESCRLSLPSEDRGSQTTHGGHPPDLGPPRGHGWDPGIIMLTGTPEALNVSDPWATL